MMDLGWIDGCYCMELVLIELAFILLENFDQ
jgi:hypothetical protein